MTEAAAPPGWLHRWSDLAMLGRAGMEALWCGLWYAALFSNELRQSPGGVGLLFWLLMVLPFGLARLLRRFKLSRSQGWGLLLAWFALAAPLSLEWLLALSHNAYPPLELAWLLLRSLTGDATPLPWLHLVVTLLLTLRGLALAAGQPEMPATVFDFQIGLVFLLLHGMTSIGTESGLSLAGLALYLLLGLMTLAATRISVSAFYHGARLPRLGWGWAAGLAGGAALVVLAGLAAGLIAASQAGSLLARLVLGVIALLALVVFIVLLPLFQLLSGLILHLADGLASFFNNPAFTQLRDLIAQITHLADLAAARGQPVLHLIQLATPLLIVLSLLGALYLALRIRENLAELRAEGRSERVSAGGALGILWEQQIARRRRRAVGLLAAARVRRIYAALLALSAKRGKARPAHLTPLEFLPSLEAVFPRHAAELNSITAAYLKVRYGEYPETLREVEAVEEAWRRVRAKARA